MCICVLCVSLALKSEIIESTSNISSVVPARTLNEVNKILKENDDLIDIYITNNFLMALL